MISCLCLGVLGLMSGMGDSRAGTVDLPAPTAPSEEGGRNVPPLPDDAPEYGADVSAGYLMGSLLGPWPVTGIHGVVFGRYDAFVSSRSTPGPRLGMSIWGSWSIGPLQEGLERDEQDNEVTAPAEFLHYGVLAGLRHDPLAPLGALAGLGFGRLDLNDYWGGPLALPTLTFEAGLRQRLPSQLFVDWLIRAHWATARSGIDPTAWEEWWMVQAGVGVGAHIH